MGQTMAGGFAGEYVVVETRASTITIAKTLEFSSVLGGVGFVSQTPPCRVMGVAVFAERQSPFHSSGYWIPSILIESGAACLHTHPFTVTI
jgi:hypothetical protein